MSTLYREQLEVELQLARGALTEGGTHRHLWVHGLLAGRALVVYPQPSCTRPLFSSTRLAACAPGLTHTHSPPFYLTHPRFGVTRVLDWHPPPPKGARPPPGGAGHCTLAVSTKRRSPGSTRTGGESLSAA